MPAVMMVYAVSLTACPAPDQTAILTPVIVVVCPFFVSITVPCDCSCVPCFCAPGRTSSWVTMVVAMGYNGCGYGLQRLWLCRWALSTPSL